MISIITPVHNCLSHNMAFLDSLKKYSHGPQELIVIDNGSRDGSSELFRDAGCQVIRNEGNLCYPESINLGLPSAKGDLVCFLNNDVFCGVDWDKHLIEGMMMYNLDIVSPCGIERMPSLPLTHLFFKRWHKVGEKKHLGTSVRELQGFLNQMYGPWEKFCQRVYELYYPKIMEGIVGNCVLLKRSVLDKIGLLDERIQAADWDIYLKVKKRSEEIGDIHRVMTVCWSYVHHFIRTTLKSNPAPFACSHSKLTLEEKWGKEGIRRLWPFAHEVEERPSFYREPLQYWKYKSAKIKRTAPGAKNEDQWIQFWKKLDRA